jgi:hypothetical protein
VALGYQGTRQYSKLRERAIDSRIQRQQSQSLPNPDTPKLDPGDYFHGGERVLPEVTSWHKYLRNSLRRTDRITSQVLDLVDQHMLVGNPELRMKSSAICEQLAHISQSLKESRTPVPDSILKFLLNVDEEIPSNAAEPVSVETVIGLRPSLNTFHDRQVRKSKYLGTPLMKTAHRSYLKSTLTVPPVDQQLSQITPDGPSEIPIQVSTTTSDESPPGFQVPQFPNAVAQPEENQHCNDNTPPPLPSSASTMTSGTGPGSPVRQKFKTTRPQDVFQAREEIENREHERKEKITFSRFLPKPKDDLLARHYKNRDIVSTIDVFGDVPSCVDANMCNKEILSGQCGIHVKSLGSGQTSS